MASTRRAWPTRSSLLGEPESLAEMRRRGREHVVREHAPAVFQKELRVALEAVDAA